MPLQPISSNLDVSFFQREGYQILENFLPIDLIDEIAAFLTLEKGKCLIDLRALLGPLSEEGFAEAIWDYGQDSEQFDALDREQQMTLAGHFKLETRLSPKLLQIPQLPIVRELFEAIYPGKQAHLHLPPTARFVLPGNRFGAVPIHQDVSYNIHIDDFFVMWVPFCEIDDERGGVEIYPGTGRAVRLMTAAPYNTKFWIPPVDVGDAQCIHHCMHKGDVLLLNKWIAHASKPNLSLKTRLSTDYRFFYGSSEKHYYDLDTQKHVSP